MDPKLLEILVCPLCKGRWFYLKISRNSFANRIGWRIRFATIFR